jgi:hypothetical protein
MVLVELANGVKMFYPISNICILASENAKITKDGDIASNASKWSTEKIISSPGGTPVYTSIYVYFSILY